jgi:poly(3-hydroxybutyrate) depolymerase
MRGLLLLFFMLLPTWTQANTESFGGAQEFHTARDRVRYLLLFPAHYDPRRTYELWLNLHGSPGCASHAIFQYQEPALRREVFLLAPQASGWSAGSYTRPDGKRDVYRAWDMHADRARILMVLDEVLSKYPIDRTHVALLGFSAGCEMGWHLLGARPNAFYFFGGVANGFKGGRPPVSEAALCRAARHVSHFYGVGKDDGFAGPMYKQTVRRLRAEGFALRTVYPAGVGHDLPPVIKEPLLAFMDAVRTRQKRSEAGRGQPLGSKHKGGSGQSFATSFLSGLILVGLACLLLMVRRHPFRR